MAGIDYPNAPTSFRMPDFMSVAQDYDGYAKSARFGVHIKPRGVMLNYSNFAQDLLYLCEASELPGRSFLNVDVRYYGPNQKLPIQSQYEDINMTFICRNKSFERQFFDDWMMWINPPNTFDFFYRDEYSCEIDIYQYSDIGTDNGSFFGPAYEHTPEYCITLFDAYPILVNPQPMTWSDDMFQRLVVNFTYTKWIRKGLDPRSGTFSLVQNAQVNLR